MRANAGVAYIVEALEAVDDLAREYCLPNGEVDLRVAGWLLSNLPRE